ncbi:MAG: hypothetical protein ACI84O_001096 [Myxococcota bacterium]|jgi:hypothetical protein
MKITRTHSLKPSQGGSVLLLVIMMTSLLAAITASFTNSIDDQINIQRDEGQALRAEFAAESGWEFAQRQLLLDGHWTGTESTVTLLDGMTKFDIYSDVDDAADVYGDAVHDINVHGMFGTGLSKLGGSIQVNEGYADTGGLGLVCLGEDMKIIYSSIRCSMLVTDIANRVDDWNSDITGDGFYSDGGANVDGFTMFNNSSLNGVVVGGSTVYGTLYKYKSESRSGLYQDGGDEVVITQGVQAPAWDFAGLTTPASGKMIISDTTVIDGLVTQDTVIIVAGAGQGIKITDSQLKGGLIVICPDGVDLRSASRNRIEFFGACSIGGGSQGFENNIGIIAPGCELLSKFGGLSLTGFNLFNQALSIKEATFTGQTVITKDVKNIHSSDFYYDEHIANNLPSFISFSPFGGSTDDQSMHEDF